MTDDILENNFVNEEHCCPLTKYNETLFFTDGVRSIDFVLAYKMDPDTSQEGINAHKRFKFEANLLQHGLQREVDINEQQHRHYVKLGEVKIYVLHTYITVAEKFTIVICSLDTYAIGCFTSLCRNFKAAYAYEGGKTKLFDFIDNRKCCFFVRHNIN